MPVSKIETNPKASSIPLCKSCHDVSDLFLAAICLPLLSATLEFGRKKRDFWNFRLFRHLMRVMSQQKDKKTKRQKYKNTKKNEKAKRQKEKKNKKAKRQKDKNTKIQKDKNTKGQKEKKKKRHKYMVFDGLRLSGMV